MDAAVFVDCPVELSCPRGHALRSFQTKDLGGPARSAYLVHAGRLYLAEATAAGAHAENGPEIWRIEGGDVVREHRFTLREIEGPLSVSLYGNCNACDPVLVCTAQPGSERVVSEHPVFASFRLSFRPGQPMHVERTSGTRAEYKDELRRRDVCVLEDDEPLAVAHRARSKKRTSM